MITPNQINIQVLLMENLIGGASRLGARGSRSAKTASDGSHNSAGECAYAWHNRTSGCSSEGTAQSATDDAGSTSAPAIPPALVCHTDVPHYINIGGSRKSQDHTP
jgi:hypothetical protein